MLFGCISKVTINPCAGKKGGVMQETWPFSDKPNLAVISTRSIIEQQYPILRVTHDKDDGSWQFLDGKAVDVSKVVVVSLSSIYALDRSIGELGDLPIGWYAWRESVSGKWIRAKKI
jgi:hypothetical protein